FAEGVARHHAHRPWAWARPFPGQGGQLQSSGVSLPECREPGSPNEDTIQCYTPHPSAARGRRIHQPFLLSTAPHPPALAPRGGFPYFGTTVCPMFAQEIR